MGRQSSITALPNDVRDWLNQALAENNFTGYEALESLLRDRGYAISKSAMGEGACIVIPPWHGISPRIA